MLEAQEDRVDGGRVSFVSRLGLHQATFDFFLQEMGWRLKGWTNGVAKCPLRAMPRFPNQQSTKSKSPRQQ